MFANSSNRNPYKMAEAFMVMVKTKQAAARKSLKQQQEKEDQDGSTVSGDTASLADTTISGSSITLSPSSSSSSSSSAPSSLFHSMVKGAATAAARKARRSFIGKDISVDSKDNNTSTTTKSRSVSFSQGTKDESSHHHGMMSEGLQLRQWTRKAEEAVHGIQTSLDKLSEQEQDLSRAVQFHQKRAQARYMANNMSGALLSLKKSHSTQWELEKVMHATDYLEEQEMQLVTLLGQYKAVSALDKSRHKKSTSSSSSASLPELADYGKHVQLILSSNAAAAATTDEQLLQEFAKLNQLPVAPLVVPQEEEQEGENEQHNSKDHDPEERQEPELVLL